MNKGKRTLDQTLTLPCGALLKNRLIKSAMSDSLGDGQGSPSQAQIRLYEKWAQGGFALSIIGEVQIHHLCPEKPGNLVLDHHADKKLLRELSKKASIEGAHIWPQLGHAGALSHKPISQPKGPSALNIDDLNCDGMTIEEVEALPGQYANAALLAKEVGFTGVQVHAGHGFLLSQFLSPLFNQRKDEYGGSIENRSQLIINIINRIRQAVGQSFPIGIKINASDLLEGGVTQEHALETIHLLDNTSLDLIEISGGTYFPGAKSSSDNTTKGVYYTEFSQKAKRKTNIPIMVTGGIKTLAEAQHVLSDDKADLVGVARAVVLNPKLAQTWLKGINQNPIFPHFKFPRFESPPPEGITAWYTMRINAIALDQEHKTPLVLETAIEQYLKRDELRCIQWQQRYSPL